MEGYNEQIKESVALGVLMLKMIGETPELAEETAKAAMRYRDAFEKEGFTKKEATRLTAGVLSK